MLFKKKQTQALAEAAEYAQVHGKKPVERRMAAV